MALYIWFLTASKLNFQKKSTSNHMQFKNFVNFKFCIQIFFKPWQIEEKYETLQQAAANTLQPNMVIQLDSLE